MKYDDQGREILDDTPIEVPVGFKRPPSIQELIALHVRAQMQVERAMGKEDEEDFEEEVEREDMMTPYELHAMAGEADVEFQRARRAHKAISKLRGGKDGRSKAEAGTGHAGPAGKSDSADGKSVAGVAGASEEASGRAASSGVAADRGKA